jgi:hypothetical protein
MTVVLRKELLDLYGDLFDFVQVEVRKSDVLGLDGKVELVRVVLEFAHVDG